MTDDELLDACKLDQERRGLMPSSIERRQHCLRVFARSLGDGGLLSATRQQIERFLDGRRGKDGGDAQLTTRSMWLAHLSEFYKWAIREDLTEVNPTAKIIRPKTSSGMPRPADTEDLHAALAVASPLHACWVLLAAYEGMRCQEIAGLKVEDVFVKKGKIAVTKGKGGKQRMLPLHPDVLAAIKALPMPHKGYVFVRPRGGPYPPAVLSAQFNKFLKGAIPERHVTAHQLRHWFGTEFYRQTHDLRLTAEVMGHSDTSTTAVYTRVDVSDAAGPLKALSFDKQEETP